MSVKVLNKPTALTEEKAHHASVQKGFKLSVITGYLSSFVNLFIILFGIPRIAGLLPKSEMAIYVAVSAIASISFWAQIGAGPALTQRISRAHAEGDEDEIRLQVQAALMLVLSMAVLCVLLGTVFLATGGFAHFYGLEQTPSKSQVLSFVFVLATAAYNLIVSPILRAQTGLHETYFKNTFNVIGNAVILLLLLTALPHLRSAPWALCIMFGPVALLDLVNAFLFFRKFKFIRSRIAFIPDSAIKAAVLDSIAYTIFELSFALVREFTKGYVGRANGQEELARFGLMLTTSVMVQALSNTVVIPLMPVFTNLIATNQKIKFRSLFLRYGAIFVALAGAGAILLAAHFNPLQILYKNYSFKAADNYAVLILGFSNVFRFYCGFALYSMAKTWAPTVFSCVGALAAGLAAFASKSSGATGMTMAFGLAGFLVYGGLQFPYILRLISRAGTLANASESEGEIETRVESGAQVASEGEGNLIDEC